MKFFRIISSPLDGEDEGGVDRRRKNPKKLGSGASARKDRRIVETLGCGSSKFKGNLRIQ